MTDTYRCEALAAHHVRERFRCGVAELDRYFRQLVTQDIRRRVTTCFVAVAADGIVAGFYTLASAGIPVNDLPPEVARRLPRYPVLPAARIGRLAVDSGYRRRGIGGILVMDAAARALRAEQANFALLVDAKDESAAAFYRHHGFAALASRPHTLFLPLATAAKLIDPSA